MKKRLIGFGAIAITTLVTAVGLQVSNAFAQDGDGNSSANWDWCKQGYFCVASQPNGQGVHAWFKYGAHDLQTDVNGVVNNSISSYKNNTGGVDNTNGEDSGDNGDNGTSGNSNGYVVYLYDLANYQGACAYQNPGETNNRSGRMDGIISSIKVSTSDTYDSQYCDNGNLHSRTLNFGSLYGR